MGSFRKPGLFHLPKAQIYDDFFQWWWVNLWPKSHIFCAVAIHNTINTVSQCPHPPSITPSICVSYPHTHRSMANCLQISPNFSECQKDTDFFCSLSQKVSILGLGWLWPHKAHPLGQWWSSIGHLLCSHILAMFQLNNQCSHKTLMLHTKHCIRYRRLTCNHKFLTVTTPKNVHFKVECSERTTSNNVYCVVLLLFH